MRIVHVITSLGLGGAEVMLAKLLPHLETLGFENRVVCFVDGPVRHHLEAAGIEVTRLGLTPNRLNPTGSWRLARALRQPRPDLVQGWLYHANLAVTLIPAALRSRPPVLWNIRHSLFDLSRERPLTRAVIHTLRRLSWKPRAIIYNSHAGARGHTAFGFVATGATVIPNGFDPGRFQPSPAHAPRLRAALGLSPETVLVGLPARVEPQKDHANLCAALARLGRADLHLMLAGSGATWDNPELVALLEHYGLRGRTHLLGRREDVETLIGGLDVLALPSAWGEAFPNVLGEAMACGTPSVATDIGDCAFFLGSDGGLVVPPCNPEALAAGLARVLAWPPAVRAERAARARQRILDHYTLPQIARAYADLYRQAGHGRAG